MLEGFPCKVIDVCWSKCGKHGHAKISVMGKDIFTQKRYEDCIPTGHNIEVPVITKTWVDLLNIDEDGIVSFYDQEKEKEGEIILDP